MKWFQNLLSLGIMFILLGVALIVISSGGFENSVFFIFPFFFSASDPVSILFILGFIIFIFVIMMRTTSTFFGQAEANFSVESKCIFCSQPLPENASFCPRCGNSVDYGTMSNTKS